MLVASGLVACAGTFQSPAAGGDPWFVASSEHFRVHTDVSAENARDAAWRYEHMYESFKEVAFPSAEQPAGVTDVVIFANQREYQELAPRFSDGYFERRGGPDYDPHPTIVMSLGASDERVEAMFQHELTHRFVAFHFPGAPTWLNEGLAEFYETADFEGDPITLGRVPAGMGFSEGEGWSFWDPDGRRILLESLPPASSIRASST